MSDDTEAREVQWRALCVELLAIVERQGGSMLDALSEAAQSAATALHQRDEARAQAMEEGFELGFEWAMMLRGQALEDSRAVGRTLYCDLFKPYAESIAREINDRGFNSFEEAESGIVAAKAIIRAALANDKAATPIAGER